MICHSVLLVAIVLSGCTSGKAATSLSTVTSARAAVSSTSTSAPGSSSLAIKGLEAVPPGYALVIEGRSQAVHEARRVQAVIIPELGVFRMELTGSTYPAEMLLTVRTPESQLGYRGQAVFEGKPRPLDMAFLESPLTYESGFKPTKVTRVGTHISATLHRGPKDALDDMIIEADVDPQTGIIVFEKQTGQYLSAQITRRLVPLASVQVPRTDEVLAFGAAELRKAVAGAQKLGYAVFGVDLPLLQLHMLQFSGTDVWSDYSTKERPGRVAVETRQMTQASAEPWLGRYPESWAPGLSEWTTSADPGKGRAFLLGNRAILVFAHDWAVKDDPKLLGKIESALVPLADIEAAHSFEPPVLIFDDYMPLPSGANFGGLLPDAYRTKSG